MSIFFISYSHKDKNFIDELEDKLQEQGFAYWIDHKIIPGEDWRKSIDDAIKASQGVILIVSENSLSSSYVTYEWSFAMGCNKTIIPLQIHNINDSQLHPKLAAHQVVKFTPDMRDWSILFGHLSDLSGQLIPFPPAVQNAVNLFDSVERSDWDKAIDLLKQNRSEYAIAALVYGCDHDTKEIRIKCALTLARKSNYQDIRCKPVILELIADIDFHQTDGLPSEVMQVVSHMKITEAEDKILDYIVYKRKIYPHDFSDDQIDFILDILDNIITPEGLNRLYFILKNDLPPGTKIKERLHKFVTNHGGIPPS